MAKTSLAKYFRGLAKDSLIYGLGNAVLKIMALLTAPIFTRLFVPADYGIISLIASVISFLSIFLLFGMDNAIFVSFYQYKKERRAVIASAFWFLFSWGLMLMVLASLFSDHISTLVFHSSHYRLFFIITFLTAFFNLLISLAKVVFRLEFRARTFALVAALNALLSTGLMIFFVVFLKKGLLGYFEGQLVGTFLSMVLALWLIRGNLSFSLNLRRLKEMVAFGAFIVPASVSFFVFDLSDRFFINHYRSLTELGLYSIGINIAGMLVFFSYALGQAWSPQAMKMYFGSRPVFQRFVPRFFTYYLVFFFGLAALISIFAQEILYIFTTPQFYEAAKVIGPLSLAMVFSASNQVTALGTIIKRRTKLFAFYTILAAILNLGLNFWLIPRFGIIGAGWATALSYLFLTLAYLWQSQRLMYLQFDWQKILKLVILSLALILLAPLSWRYSASLNILIKIAEIFVYALALYLLAVIDKNEVNYLKEAAQRLLSRQK